MSFSSKDLEILTFKNQNFISFTYSKSLIRLYPMISPLLLVCFLGLLLFPLAGCVGLRFVVVTGLRFAVVTDRLPLCIFQVETSRLSESSHILLEVRIVLFLWGWVAFQHPSLTIFPDPRLSSWRGNAPSRILCFLSACNPSGATQRPEFWLLLGPRSSGYKVKTCSGQWRGEWSWDRVTVLSIHWVLVCFKSCTLKRIRGILQLNVY